VGFHVAEVHSIPLWSAIALIPFPVILSRPSINFIHPRYDEITFGHAQNGHRDTI
jgi:hypothetical protein